MSYFRTFIFEKVSFLKSSVFNTSYTAKYCLNVHFFFFFFLNVITVTGERHKQPISTTPCALVAEHINTDFLSALLTTLASVLTLSSRQGNTRVFALKLREIRSL